MMHDRDFRWIVDRVPIMVISDDTGRRRAEVTGVVLRGRRSDEEVIAEVAWRHDLVGPRLGATTDL
jgi:hypothetical protein